MLVERFRLRLARRLGSDTLRHHAPANRAVAACSQAGIGYTETSARRRDSHVAACSQAGIGYTISADDIHAVQLRLARRLGSDTLFVDDAVIRRCCGLLAGWDRIHLPTLLASHRMLRLARRLGSDTLLRKHKCVAAVAACSQAGIGYTDAQG